MQIEHPDGYHRFCPKIWRKVPNITGSYELDGSLMGNRNPDLPGKMQTHLSRENSYGYRTGYDAYSGISGDD